MDERLDAAIAEYYRRGYDICVIDQNGALTPGYSDDMLEIVVAWLDAGVNPYPCAG